MKAREPRKKILVAARIRAGMRWGDVRLLNLSSRGALVQASSPPPQGAYIEIRRGPHVIVARVMWTDENCFGIYSQDAIAVDEVISERGGSAPQKSCRQNIDCVERRSSARHQTAGDRHERSRLVARSAEFCCLAAIAAIFASFAFSLVQESMARPMAQVEAILAAR